MRTETRKQIREAVLYDMAPAQAGQVTLEDVARVFRGRAQLEDVQQCLGEFVKEGIARETELSGRTYYLFEGMANEAVADNERRLREIEKALADLKMESEQMDQLLEKEELAQSHLRPIWLNDWEESKLGSEEISKIQRYIAAQFGRHSEGHYRENRNLEAEIKGLEEERRKRLKWKEETFITVHAS